MKNQDYWYKKLVKKVDFFSMFLRTLAALAGQGVIRANEGTIRAGENL